MQVSTNYPGANAKVVADTVAAPIEQQINGVENMMYMSSTSSADGSYRLTITFEIGTNLDDAQVLVQNRLSVAEPSLPEEVRRQGVTVRKQSSNIVLAISLTAPPPKDKYRPDARPGRAGGSRRHRRRGAGRRRARPALTHRAAPATAKPGYLPRHRADQSSRPTGRRGADKLRRIGAQAGQWPHAGAALGRGPRRNAAGTYDGLFLSNYATLKLRDELSRVKGVGDVMVRGVGAYSMRVWLNPDKLAARQTDHAGRDRARSSGRTCRSPPGRSASRPTRPGQRFQFTVTTLGRLSDPKQFREDHR